MEELKDKEIQEETVEATAEETTAVVEEQTDSKEKKVKAEAKAETKPEAKEAPKQPSKRIVQGVVVSDKADKTILVKHERQVAHPLYRKIYKRSKKLMAHDENNECKQGDVVRIKECRPLSARKRWELIEIVQRAK